MTDLPRATSHHARRRAPVLLPEGKVGTLVYIDRQHAKVDVGGARPITIPADDVLGALGPGTRPTERQSHKRRQRRKAQP